jgi:hypothetical protein
MYIYFMLEKVELNFGDQPNQNRDPTWDLVRSERLLMV